MKSKRGFTLVEVMIVVGIIALLAVIALPSLFKSRTESQKKGCINSLRIMSNAKEPIAAKSGWIPCNRLVIMRLQWRLP
jgi:prepilin-type N-terminal cleavage/methylation domain-containing protein